MRSSIIQCYTDLVNILCPMMKRTFSSCGEKSKFLCFFYFLMIINLCTSSFNGDKNNFNNNHFTTHHPLRHHRHHALNRTHNIPNYHHHQIAETVTTRSPIESVRNFLSSREHDTKRNYFHVSGTRAPLGLTKRPVYAASHKSKVNTTKKGSLIQSSHQPIQRTNGNIETYQKVKEKNFDDIIREISQFKKRKRFHKTSTSTTTTTTEPSLIEDEYEEYDDEDFQDDEGLEKFTQDNGHLLPEQQTSRERFVQLKKVRKIYLNCNILIDKYCTLKYVRHMQAIIDAMFVPSQQCIVKKCLNNHLSHD